MLRHSLGTTPIFCYDKSVKIYNHMTGCKPVICQKNTDCNFKNMVLYIYLNLMLYEDL